MAIFPSLKPSGRIYTPGEYPHTPFNAYNGFQNRVRHSNVMLASRLRLNFVALTETQMLSILSHYQGQFGSYESFDLPADVWSGVSTVADYNLTGYLWRYIEAPTVEDVYCNLYNVELALETVPPDGATVDGLWRVVVINLTAASAATASGLNKTVTVTPSFSGYQQEGLTTTVSCTLAAGTAAASSGATLSVAAILAGGSGASAEGAAISVAVTFQPGTATTTTPAGASVDSLTRLVEDDLLELLF